MTSQNNLGQPIGETLENWSAPQVPPRQSLQGQTCRIEPLDAKVHADDLFEAFSLDRENRLWTYMSVGPFPEIQPFYQWIEQASQSDDPLFYAIIDQDSGKAVGYASYLRIDPANGVIEVGNITYSPKLQKTNAGTEAMYLMMKRALSDLGYRRYEWKCDDLNAASKAAARRYGFVFEGVFRQAVIYKNRNRDTAWFSITDAEWPAVEAAFVAWLSPDNHDSTGAQKKSLAEMRTL